MPTITGTSVLDNAETVLQDTANTRWARAELLAWLNDGQRAAVALKPELSTTTAAVLLTAGVTKQTIPTTATRLLNVTRNMGAAGSTPGAAIRVVDRASLDAFVPTWHADANAAGLIQHFIPDAGDPRTFYVYPKAPATAWYVEVVTSVPPADTNDSGWSIGIDDIYAPALLNYVLYRAYAKDAEAAASAQLATSYFAAFRAELGVA